MKRHASAICSARPAITTRGGLCQRLSLNSQAVKSKPKRPKAPCKTLIRLFPRPKMPMFQRAWMSDDDI